MPTRFESPCHPCRRTCPASRRSGNEPDRSPRRREPPTTIRLSGCNTNARPRFTLPARPLSLTQYPTPANEESTERATCAHVTLIPIRLTSALTQMKLVTRIRSRHHCRFPTSADTEPFTRRRIRSERSGQQRCRRCCDTCSICARSTHLCSTGRHRHRAAHLVPAAVAFQAQYASPQVARRHHLLIV